MSLEVIEAVYYGVVFFLFGSLIGSFLNVVIYRLPECMSLSYPGSHCTTCFTPVAWYDNIPILSWFVLRGRCRHCGTSYSFRYPAVEMITALLFLLIYLMYGLQPISFVYCYLMANLVVITMTDIDHMLILDECTYPGMIIGFLAAGLGWLDITWLESFVGIAFGGGYIGLLALYGLVRQKEMMGMGDLKYAAMAGAYLGWERVFLAICIGGVSALVIMGLGIASGKFDHQQPFPFGPFLVFGTLFALFLGDPLIAWWLPEEIYFDTSYPF